LKEKGIAEIFTPGATTATIVAWIKERVGAAA
ncbi:MAG: methylmalonyl-CoA mutase, partial [Actinomycetota bacterium]